MALASMVTVDGGISVDIAIGRLGDGTLPRVIVEGVDISKYCHSLKLEARVGEITILTLGLYPKSIEAGGDLLPNSVKAELVAEDEE